MKKFQIFIQKYDFQILFPIFLLVGIGIIMVYSASSVMAAKKYGDGSYFVFRQAIFAVVGIITMLIGRQIPTRVYQVLTYPLIVLSILLLLAIPFTPMGFSAGGSARWLRLGPIMLQPSELARFAMIVWLAYSITKKTNERTLRYFSVGFFPHVLMMVFFVGLILLQPDFGSTTILVAITFLILFIGGVRLRHFLATLIVIVPAGLYIMLGATYRLKRITAFLDPWAYASDLGYQIIHSMMAFGSGKIWGTGIGQGVQKLFYLPEPHTDFIFAVIGEELGLIGIVVVVFLFAMIIRRGLRIALNASSMFDSLLAAGLTCSLGLQVTINMGVNLGLLPTKGLPLPLISYGGSSLVITMFTMGVLMNISAMEISKK